MYEMKPEHVRKNQCRNENLTCTCRFVTAVYPSADDDVITSPYNSVLAMRELTEKADCVLPVENQVGHC